MIRPPGFAGAAFGTAEDGDGRLDAVIRRRIAEELGIPDDWAYAKQVHGNVVLEVETAGHQGEGDALFTRLAGLPLTISTADCVPIVIEGRDVASVVHAGWRGLAAGVVTGAVQRLGDEGRHPERAAIGPAIGPCCYEVGEEVAEQLSGHVTKTTWGTLSVDLPRAAAEQLGDVTIWSSGRCTHTSDDLHSYRRDRDPARQIALAWLPAG